MDKTPINPWTWQDARGFTQAWRVEGAAGIVFVAGQGPFAPDGSLVGGDFEAQVRHTLDNLGTVLEQSGASFADVVKLTVFLTDITQLPVYARVKAGYITGQQPASTAVQVQALALPGMQIEIEAIAVSREPE